MWVLLLACASTALAHGADANRLTLEVEDAVVRVTATPGIAALRDADTNGDGLLMRDEVGAARAAIRDRFQAAFHLSELIGRDAECGPASVSTIGDGADHVRVSARCVFAERPGAIVVSYTLPGDAALAVEAVRVWRIAEDRWAPEGLVDRAMLPAAGGAALVLQDLECPL